MIGTEIELMDTNFTLNRYVVVSELDGKILLVNYNIKEKIWLDIETYNKLKALENIIKEEGEV